MSNIEEFIKLKKRVSDIESRLHNKVSLSKIEKSNIDFKGIISFTTPPLISDLSVSTSGYFANSTSTVTGTLNLTDENREYVVNTGSNFNINFTNFTLGANNTYTVRLVINPTIDGIFHGTSVSGVTVDTVPKTPEFVNVHTGTGTDYIIQEITISVDEDSNVNIMSKTNSYSTTESNNKSSLEELTIDNNLSSTESKSMVVLKTDSIDATDPADSKSLFDFTGFSELVTTDSLNNSVSTGYGKTFFLDQTTLLLKCKVPENIVSNSTGGYYYLPLLKVTETP